MAYMKVMAGMCLEMMQREKAMMPAKMAAAVVLGLLVLLVVLQVQWNRSPGSVCVRRSVHVE